MKIITVTNHSQKSPIIYLGTDSKKALELFFAKLQKNEWYDPDIYPADFVKDIMEDLSRDFELKGHADFSTHEIQQ